MGRDNGQGPLNTLKPQPGQTSYEKQVYHPLPGAWAQEQLTGIPRHSKEPSMEHHGGQTEIQKAIASERQVHDYWEKWQGVKTGTPVYEDPRAFQNTLLPVAKYGTDGKGD